MVFFEIRPGILSSFSFDPLAVEDRSIDPACPVAEVAAEVLDFPCRAIYCLC